jgi:hypothetical protein
LKDENHGDAGDSEAYCNQLGKGLANYSCTLLMFLIQEMIKLSFPWWDTLHGWWSEHPKYAFQMVTNSTSGVEKMVGDLEQAVSSPAELDKQVLDEEDENSPDSVCLHTLSAPLFFF